MPWFPYKLFMRPLTLRKRNKNNSNSNHEMFPRHSVYTHIIKWSRKSNASFIIIIAATVAPPQQPPSSSFISIQFNAVLHVAKRDRDIWKRKGNELKKMPERIHKWWPIHCLIIGMRLQQWWWTNRRTNERTNKISSQLLERKLCIALGDEYISYETGTYTSHTIRVLQFYC